MMLRKKNRRSKGTRRIRTVEGEKTGTSNKMKNDIK